MSREFVYMSRHEESLSVSSTDTEYSSKRCGFQEGVQALTDTRYSQEKISLSSALRQPYRPFSEFQCSAFHLFI